MRSKIQTKKIQNQAIKPLFDEADVKKQIREHSKTHQELLTGYYDVTDKIYQKKDVRLGLLELIKQVSDFDVEIKIFENKQSLNSTFHNEFMLLKLKTMILLGRVLSLNVTTILEYEYAVSIFVSALELFALVIQHCDYKKDLLFQEEMYFCLCEMWRKKLNPSSFNPLNLKYEFSKKCSDNTIKLLTKTVATRQLILGNAIDQIEKKILYQEYNDIYKDIVSQFEKLKEQNKLDIEARSKYISATLEIFNYLYVLHPGVRGVKFPLIFDEKNKSNLTKYFKIFKELAQTHFKKFIKLICETELVPLKAVQIGYFRFNGKQALELLKEQLELFLKWNQMLNADSETCEKEKESYRDVLVQLYKMAKDLHVFYTQFFNQYPEQDYGDVTKTTSLFHEKDDFQNKMDNPECINQLIARFTNESIISDALYREEKQKRLDISEESACFLIALENREREFRLKKIKANLPKPSIILVKEKQEKHKIQEPVQTIELPLLERAYQSITNHKYNDAILMYELAYEKAKQNQDSQAQLRALDGLSIAYGHFILKDLGFLNHLLQARLTNALPLTSVQRISLEESVNNIILKLNVLKSSNTELVQLAQSFHCSTEEINQGIRFAQTLIIELIQYAQNKIKEAQDNYQCILKNAETERNKFILKLGTNEAKQLKIKANHTELMKLGQAKFAELGKKKPEENYSDHTQERCLLKELVQTFKQLSDIPNHILSLASQKTQPSKAPIYKNAEIPKAQMVMGTFTLNLPTFIQNQFDFLSQFKQEHYLHGSTLFEIILQMNQQKSINPEDIDFITKSTNQALMAAVLKPCKHNDKLYFYNTPQGRLELLNIEDEPFTFMANRLFTISTLFCSKEGLLHDLTGRGINDLLQRRLVMMSEPSTALIKDPTSILFILKYRLKGFHPEVSIIEALKNLKPLNAFDKSHFNAIAKKQLSQLNYAGRKYYVKLLLDYNLLNKLFHIHYNFKIRDTIAQLEQQLGVESVSIMANSHGLFAKHSFSEKEAENKEQLIINNH